MLLSLTHQGFPLWRECYTFYFHTYATFLSGIRGNVLKIQLWNIDKRYKIEDWNLLAFMIRIRITPQPSTVFAVQTMLRVKCGGNTRIRAIWGPTLICVIIQIHVIANHAIKRFIWAASRQNQQNGLCTQQRLRSAWASAQSDQSSLSAWRKLGSWATHWAHSKDSDSDREDAQADLSLCWAHSHFVGFVMRWLICSNFY